MEIKICTKCKKELSTKFFFKEKYRKDGFYPSCKNCYRKRLGIKERVEPWSLDSCGYRSYKGKRLHRKIMEDFLKRKLLKTEVVHHINYNKLDNRIENLQLLSNIEHHKLHYKERLVGKNGRFIKNA